MAVANFIGKPSAALAEDQAATLQEKLEALAELEADLADVDEKIKQRDALLAELSRVDIRDILRARIIVKRSSGTTKTRKVRQVAMGEPDAKLWTAVKKKFFKDGDTAQIDKAAREQIAADHKTTIDVVNGTIAANTTTEKGGAVSFQGPRGAFVVLR